MGTHCNCRRTIKEDEAYGTLSAEAQFKIGNEPFFQHYVFYLKDMNYKKPQTDIGFQGIACTLSVKSFVPFLTDSNQHVTFKNAYTGTFQVENGNIAFGFPANDRVIVSSMEMNWAGGKLSGKNMQMEFSQPRLALDVNIEGLDLQSILNFIEYKDVSGDGKIFGHVPITFNWEKRMHLSFGNGFLEARPPIGGLRFSKEIAMRILGIKKEINPKTKDAEEAVSLMMIRALQDFEYSSLRMVFQNDENHILKAKVETKGYGPRGAKENIIPIGGLNINISSLDDLLNQMISNFSINLRT